MKSAPCIEYRYVGSPDTPETIRLGHQTIFKGAAFWLPEDFDFAAEYGSDVRHALRIERKSPPTGTLQPVGDALEVWQLELQKAKRKRSLA